MKALHFAIGYRKKTTAPAAAADHTRYILRAPANDAAELAEYVTRSTGYVREDLIDTGTGNLPDWAQGNPVRFFEESDRWERARGRTATQITAALPRELTHAQQREVVEAFVRSQLGDRHAYVWGIHETTASDGGRYPHVHIAFSERADTGRAQTPQEYFAQQWNPKDRSFHDREWPTAARQAWSDALNMGLEQAGVAERVSARSFADQGLERSPADYISRQQLQRNKALLHERDGGEDTPTMQAQRREEWDARKMALGITQGMAAEEVAQRIGDASRTRDAATGQRQGLHPALDVIQDMLTRAGQAQQQAEAQLAKAQAVTAQEAAYTAHLDRLRSMEHLVEVAEVLQGDDSVARNRTIVRDRDDEDDEHRQRRTYGYHR